MKYKIIAVLAFILLAFSSILFAKSPVWKISKGQQYLFLGGTIHVLSSNDYPLPTVFEQTYSKADRIFFEADLKEMENPVVMQKMMANILYPDGADISQYLSKKTYQLLTQFLAERAVAIDALKRFKSGMLSMTMTLMEMRRLNIAGAGVDEFYFKKTERDSKKTGFLETIDEQLSFLFRMGEGNEEALISHTLKELEELPTLLQFMKTAWRKGDNPALDQKLLSPMRTQFPKIHQMLIINRNQQWLKKIEEMLENDEIEFILCGAMHLIGTEGLIEQLKIKGYQVENL